ncbi:nucleoside-diphosphate kinase [Enterococcus sp. HY326]|uniref:nucleoside-diphosphate kinase n=1 Tax=Enterococcus sp. HY326 TaxID=2971265 RepID=UPI0022404C61|nr:nucleoside-diphosphate kinase [Enterococcus sp. HY326]
MESTLVIIKPDGVKRKLIGRVIQRFEEKGLALQKLKYEVLTEEVLKEHYSHLVNKPFFPELVAYMTSGPVVLMILEGENVVKNVRKLVGATDPFEAAVGTLRGDFGLSKTENLVHASDSERAALTEIARFFPA